MKYRPIQIGDEVTVTFINGDILKGEVKHVPVATGDSWALHTDQNRIVYIQMFETMEVKEVAE